MINYVGLLTIVLNINLNMHAHELFTELKLQL